MSETVPEALTPKQYTDALKKVQAKKPKDNFLQIEISYDKYLILPYAQGLAFLATLQQAEQLNNPYNARRTITAIEKDRYKCTVMSRKEYDQIKVAMLLDLSVADLEHLDMETVE